MSTFIKLVFLFLLFFNSVIGYSNPENSHMLGNTWFCNDGYRKQDNECVRLSVPENAHVLGNNWFCNDGYRKKHHGCVEMTDLEKSDLKRVMENQVILISDGTIAYQTKVESDSGNIIRLENGGIVEVPSYFGYIGYRKNAILYGSQNRCRIWIAGKTSYNCNLIKPPEAKGFPAKEVHISEVRSNGSIIIMLDGSIYEVDTIEQIYTSLWLGFSDGLLINGTKLVNFNADQSVTVYKIR